MYPSEIQLPTYLNLKDFITLTILVKGTNYEVSHCAAYSEKSYEIKWADWNELICETEKISRQSEKSPLFLLYVHFAFT